MGYREIIFVCYVLLDGISYEDVKGYASLLPKDRQEKIERLRFEKDKLQSLAAGLLIRYITRGAELVYNEHGKPYRKNGGKFFNVSHCDNCVVAVKDCAEIGIDVEKPPTGDFMKIAERFFHPREISWIKGEEDRAWAFSYIWTRKEAYLKQQGKGLATDLKSLNSIDGKYDGTIFYMPLEEYSVSVCLGRRVTCDLFLFPHKLSFEDLI